MPDEPESGRRKELDKEISSYISGLRRKEKSILVNFLKSLKRKRKKPRAELHPEVSVYGKGEEEKKKSKEEMEKENLEKEFEEGTKRKTFWGWLKEKLISGKEPEEGFEEEGEMEEEEKKEKEEEEFEEALEEEYKEEVQKPGWISRLISRIFVKSREEEELEEASDEIAEDIQDMKAIAEISTKVMKMLPPEKLKEFKQSEDFKAFKEILKKRELIK